MKGEVRGKRLSVTTRQCGELGSDTPSIREILDGYSMRSPHLCLHGDRVTSGDSDRKRQWGREECNRSSGLSDTTDVEFARCNQES